MDIKPQQGKIPTCQQFDNSFLVECLVPASGLPNCSYRRDRLRILLHSRERTAHHSKKFSPVFLAVTCVSIKTNYHRSNWWIGEWLPVHADYYAGSRGIFFIGKEERREWTELEPFQERRYPSTRLLQTRRPSICIFTAPSRGPPPSFEDLLSHSSICTQLLPMAKSQHFQSTVFVNFYIPWAPYCLPSPN